MSEHETRPGARPDDRAQSQQDPSADRRGGVQLGRLFGVPVYLNGFWFVLAGLIVITYGNILAGRPDFTTGTAYTVAGAFVVCLLISVLLHELGHALTARRFHIRVR